MGNQLSAVCFNEDMVPETRFIMPSPTVRAVEITDGACLSYKLEYGEFRGYTIGELLDHKFGIDFLLNLKNKNDTSEFLKMIITRSARIKYEKLNKLMA